MTAYLLSGPNYERGNQESVPYQYQGHLNNEEQEAYAEWRPEEGSNEEEEQELNNEEQAAYAEWRPEAREELNNEEQAAYEAWPAQGNGDQGWYAQNAGNNA